MQAASDAAESGMVSVVGLSSDKVTELCEAIVKQTGKPIAIANYLVDGNYAISGAKESCEIAGEVGKTFGARMTMKLAVAGAFHTAFMQPAVPRLTEVLASVNIQTPRIPVVSNVDGKAHSDPQEIRDILAKQVTYPVQWETIMTNLLKSPEFVKAYEVGPGTVCKGIVKRFNKKLEVISVTA